MSRKVAVASLIWGFSILLSRLIGIIREAVIGRVLGGGQEADLYFLAFTLPDFLYYLLAGGALSIVFIPIFSGHIARGDERRGWESFSTIANFILLLLAFLLPALWLFSPGLARLIGPGLDAEASARLVYLTRIMLPAQLFHLLGGLLSAVLLSRDRHLVPALAPLVYTLAVIGGGLWPGAGAEGFAWGVLAGSVLGPFALPLFAALRTGLRWQPILRGGHPDLKAYVLRSLPIMLSFSVVAVDDWILRRLGSLISEGAVSTLNYAKQLMKVPMGVFGFAMAVAAFPTLTRKIAEGDRKGAWNLLSSAVRYTLVLALGAQVVLTSAGREISQLLYGNRIDAAQHADIGLALTVLCLGLWGWAVQGLIARGFYALGNTWIPSVTGTLVLVVMYPLYTVFGSHWGTTGLAAASSIAISIYVMMIGIILKKRFDGLESGHAHFLRRIVPALVVAVAFGLAARQVLPLNSTVLRMLVFGGIGAAAYGAAVLAFNVREARILLDRLLGKILRRLGGGPGGGTEPLAVGAGSKEDHDALRCRIVVTGGGTGGHVYPALAILGQLERCGMIERALYLGVKGRAEEAIVPRQGIPFQTIHSAPVAGMGFKGKCRAAAQIGRGALESLIILLRFRPRLVLATGGYVSAPVVLAAALMKPFLRLKIVINEQNLVPGLLNKVASLAADVVLVSHRETSYFIWSNRCVYSGYPLRDGYGENGEPPESIRRRLGVPEQAFFAVVYGGSMGARSINRAVARSIKDLAAIPDLFIFHSLGLARGRDYDALADTRGILEEKLGTGFDAESLTGRTESGRIFYKAVEYCHDFFEIQRAADLLVSRAGAGSIAEMTALGRAALLIPKRGLPGDHQELNAVGIAEKGGAEVLFEMRDPQSGEDRIEPRELCAELRRLATDTSKRRSLQETARALYFPHTEKVILETVRTVLRDEEPVFLTETVEPSFVRFQRLFDALILHLDRNPKGLYHALYDKKVDEFLGSTHELTVNKGIKLVGSLRRTDRYPLLAARFPKWRGFLRRNAVAAFRKAEGFHPEFAEVARLSLSDPYWEVRREGIALIAAFSDHFREDETIAGAVVRRALKPIENFEVRVEAVRAAVMLLPEDDFFRLSGRFTASRAVRLREAVLDAVRIGIRSGRITDRPKARRLLNRVVVTTSDFSPAFRIRERFLSAVKSLEDKP